MLTTEECSRAYRFRLRKGERLRTKLVYEVPVILKERTIFPLPSNILWAAEVDIDSITVWLDYFGRGEQLVRIVGTKLDDEWPINGWVPLFAAGNIEVIVAVCFVGLCGEHLGAGSV